MEKLRDHGVKSAFVLNMKNIFKILADTGDYTDTGLGDANIKWKQVKIYYKGLPMNKKAQKGIDYSRHLASHTVEDRRAIKKKLDEAKLEWLKNKYKKQGYMGKLIEQECVCKQY